MMIRTAGIEDAAGISRVHISSWQTTYRGIVPDTYLKNMNYLERMEKWNRILTEGMTKTWVAENNGEIAGFINGGPERTRKYDYDGELYAIYILKDYQRQGIGRKLVNQFVKSLKSQGYKRMLVWVLEDNPSKCFYESLDAEKVDEKPITIGGVDLMEIAYGWSDISLLCGKLG